MLLAAVSCEKGPDSGEGPGGSGSEIRFPSGNIFSTGDDVIIICSGVSPDAAFYLVDASGGQTLLENVTVTASGIFFTLYAPTGEYTIAVEQDGTRSELGKITVTAGSIDITVTGVPGYCLPGGSFTVEGTGFGSSAILVLADGNGQRTPLETEVSGSTTLTAAVPEDAPRGKMSLMIVQDNGEMTVSRTFFVTSKKRLSAITYNIAPGTSYEHAYSLHPVWQQKEGTVTGFEEYTVEATTGSGGEYTDYSFTPVSDEYGYSDFRLRVSGDRVVSSTFETTQGGVEDYYTFGWEYDSEGYVSYAESNGSNGSIWLDTVDGNISLEEFWIDCTYGDPGLANNPFAVDFTISVIASECEIFRVAQVMGLTGRASANLPTSLDGKEVSYEYDGEGYVTGASYTDPFNAYSVTIQYTYE